MRLWFQLALSLAAVSVRGATYASNFKLGDCNSEGCESIVAYTEGQMFAKGDGPPSFLLSDDTSAYMSFNATLTTPSDWPQFSWYQFSAFGCTREFYDKHVLTMECYCSKGMAVPIAEGNGASQNLTLDFEAGTNHVAGRFEVLDSVQQLLVLRVCQQDPYLGLGLEVEAEMKFDNTYGLVPGKLVGYIPVYFILTLATALTFLVYLIFAICHWRELLLLQGLIMAAAGLIMAVQLLCILEAATWLGYLLYINQSGDPFCCPLAPAAMFAIACTVLKHLISRVLMTLVSIGFGVVRQTITWNEIAGLLVLSIFYLGLGFLDEVAQGNSFGEAGGELLWGAGLMVCDMGFIYWVITGMRTTMDGLSQNRTSLKYKMYMTMSTVLSVFLVAWALYGVLVLALNALLDFGPFETLLLGSLWPVIYFAFLLTISIIWRPSTVSHMLAMSYELSTNDLDPDVELDNMTDGGMYDMNSPDIPGPVRTMVSVDLDDDHADMEDSPRVQKSLL